MFLFGKFRELSKSHKEAPRDSRNLFHTNTTRTSAIRCRKERMAPFGQKSRIPQLFASTIFVGVVHISSTGSIVRSCFLLWFQVVKRLWLWHTIRPFLKGFPYSWRVCHCCKRHASYLRNWTPSIGVQQMLRPSRCWANLLLHVVASNHRFVWRLSVGHLFWDSFPLKKNYVYIHVLQLYMNIWYRPIT